MKVQLGRCRRRSEPVVNLGVVTIATRTPGVGRRGDPRE